MPTLVDAAILAGDDRLRRDSNKSGQCTETTSYGIAEIDASGIVTFASQSFAAMYGYDPEEMVGKSILDFQISDSEKQKIRGYLESLIGKQPVPTPWFSRQRTKDGRRIRIQVDWNYKRNDRGEVTGFICVVTDITQRNQAEKSLRESRRMYRTLVEFSPDGVFVHIGGSIVFANPAMAKMLGARSPESLTGMRVLDLVHPDCRDAIRDRMARGFDLGEPVPLLEQKLVRLDGSVFYAEAVAAPITYQGQKASQVLVRDITERKRAEEELKRFKFMVENCGQEAYLVRPDGRLDYVNPVAARSLGYTVDEMLALGVPGIDPLFGPVFEQHFFELKEKGLPAFETVHLSKDGRKIPKEIKSVYLRMGSEEFVCGFGSDITERKKAEHRLKISLEEKEVLIRELHHRVKNNLQLISSLLRLQSRALRGACAQVLGEASARVQSMALVHEMLYSVENVAHLDIAKYISRLTKNLLHSCPCQGCAIDVELDIGEVHIDIESALPLGMLLNEIVSNALRHAFPKKRNGRIRISLGSPEAGEVELTVADDGIGFPEAVNWKEPHSFGLQLIKTVVDQLNGLLEITRNGGTVVRVRFKEISLLRPVA